MGSGPYALIQTKFLKQVMYKSKYHMIIPEVVKKFDKKYFLNYMYFDFADVDKKNEEPKIVKTILRRKSIEKIFIQDNFKFLERETSDLNSLNNSVGADVGKRRNSNKDNRMLGSKKDITPIVPNAKRTSISKVRVDYLLSYEQFVSKFDHNHEKVDKMTDIESLEKIQNQGLDKTPKKVDGEKEEKLIRNMSINDKLPNILLDKNQPISSRNLERKNSTSKNFLDSKPQKPVPSQTSIRILKID